MRRATDPHWVLVVPVKRADEAKSRLHYELDGRADSSRPELARAFADDCIAAARRADSVVEVLVVTDDPAISAAAGARGCHVVADLPAAGLNPALRYGAEVARHRLPDCGVAALLADLPALRSNELSDALVAAAAHPRSFVADARGGGTTLLTAGPGYGLDPRFEHSSRQAHLASGAIEIDDPLPSVRCDVDDLAALRTAWALGLGPATREVLQRSEAVRSLR